MPAMEQFTVKIYLAPGQVVDFIRCEKVVATDKDAAREWGTKAAAALMLTLEKPGSISVEWTDTQE